MPFWPNNAALLRVLGRPCRFRLAAGPNSWPRSLGRKVCPGRAGDRRRFPLMSRHLIAQLRMRARSSMRIGWQFSGSERSLPWTGYRSAAVLLPAGIELPVLTSGIAVEHPRASLRRGRRRRVLGASASKRSWGRVVPVGPEAEWRCGAAKNGNHFCELECAQHRIVAIFRPSNVFHRPASTQKLQMKMKGARGLPEQNHAALP